MSDSTNIFNNKKYAIVKDNKVVDCILIHPDDVEIILPTATALRNADEAIEVSGELSWIGVDAVKDNGVWRTAPSHKGWVWGENGWEAPTEKPGDNYIWNEIVERWVALPE